MPTCALQEMDMGCLHIADLKGARLASQRHVLVSNDGFHFLRALFLPCKSSITLCWPLVSAGYCCILMLGVADALLLPHH